MSKAVFQNVKGVLFDLDGVVHVEDTPIDGAPEVLAYLDSKGITYRFLTNTTTQLRESLCEKLNRIGLTVTTEEIITTHRVAAAFLAEKRGASCYFVTRENVLTAYKGVPVSESNPDYIVIGDIGDRWSYTLLNDIFNLVMNGAQILALHRGRYWQTEKGLQLDIGAFVAGLEYATGRSAIVMGKPSANFFEMGVTDMGLKKEDVIMIGDDVESDVGGAQQAGIAGVLVQTGKYREDAVRRSTVRPDAVISSITDLMELI